MCLFKEETAALGEVAQLRQFNVDNASPSVDSSACVKHDFSDIKLMLTNLSSEEKLEINQEEVSYAETV